VELLLTARQEGGATASARYPLQDSVTLGRGPDSPLLLDATGISREHFRLQREVDAVLIIDLSSNGTWVNAQKLTRGQPKPLALGDEIKVPGFQIEIEWAEQTAVTLKRQPAIEGVPPPGGVHTLQKFAASFSAFEKLMLLLALVTLSAVFTYLSS